MISVIEAGQEENDGRRKDRTDGWIMIPVGLMGKNSDYV